jgi:hypothetical protein
MMEEEMDMHMDQMGDPYGQEEMDAMEDMMEEEEYEEIDQGISFDKLRNTIEKQEDAGKDLLA